MRGSAEISPAGEGGLTLRVKDLEDLFLNRCGITGHQRYRLGRTGVLGQVALEGRGNAAGLTDEREESRHLEEGKGRIHHGIHGPLGEQTRRPEGPVGAGTACGT